MSTTGSSTTGRTRKLQDDLLDDLRRAAPMPVARPTMTHPAPGPAERPDSTDVDALTLEVRVTPRRWSAPGMRTSASGMGFVVIAGPVQLSFSRFGR